MEAPFVLDRNHARLTEAEAGMQSCKVRRTATNMLRIAGRQAGKQVDLEERTHSHKSPSALKQ
jgi:hypothetical protein